MSNVGDGNIVAIKGPLGQLEWKLANGVSAAVENGHLIVNRNGNASNLRALHGLTRAELFNQIEGVVEGVSTNSRINRSWVSCPSARPDPHV